jgi:hypothetical protein
VFSVPWGSVVLLEIFSNRRPQIPTGSQRRSGTRMLVRAVVAALCIQTLAGCAGPQTVADAAAVRAPVGSISSPVHALRQSQSRPDCQFKVGGLGDTWPDADEAASRNCPAGRRAGRTSKSSCAAACSHGEALPAAESNRSR